MTGSKARIAIGNGSLVGYPQAGGLWSWLLQYLLGLRSLGHDVLWLEQFRGTGDPVRDRSLIDGFFARMRDHGLDGSCVVLYENPNSLDHAAIYGAEARSVRRFVKSADVVWNLAGTIANPLLSQFRRRALLDGDPGHLQVSALDWDLGIDDHESLLTVGGKLHDGDCEVPTLGRTWLPFPPPVHLPFWEAASSSGCAGSRFTSVTQWNWGELWWGERVLSISKRDAYMRYIDLPKVTRVDFELAVNLPPSDPEQDRSALLQAGWRIVDAHAATSSPSAYRRYISRSRAELCCPKPIFRELRTGWFSDRSAAYLATGRPVLAEDTGFSDWLPTGTGLVAFSSLDEAVAGAEAIEADYAEHADAARQVAADHLDARKVLSAMVEATAS